LYTKVHIIDIIKRLLDQVTLKNQTTDIMLSQESTVILWKGKSCLNGEPIMVIVSGIILLSQNSKTGPVLQTYILEDNLRLPSENVSEGTDRSICGDCPLRRQTCYVLPHQAINNVWKIFHSLEGNVWKPLSKPIWLSTESLEIIRIKRRVLRLGSYGDPVAVPIEAWEPLIAASSKTLGYTHQWQNPSIDPRWKNYLMASVESIEQARLARSLGWRTYRIKCPGEKNIEREITCPNEVNRHTQCLDCLLCDGGGEKPNISVTIHGADNKIKAYLKLDRSSEV
jgi:hypothetical protein